MLGTNLKPMTARVSAMAAALLAVPLAVAAFAPQSQAASANQELTIKITNVRLLDKVDELSKGDLYARVVIDGEVQKTLVVKGENVIKPDWKISKKVSRGEHKVKIELDDKDVTQDDMIDINRVDKKRDLDFTVNTKSCRVNGFSSTYKCGSSITRAGTEDKKAEITFTVTVKK
jgi:C2 domain